MFMGKIEKHLAFESHIKIIVIVNKIKKLSSGLFHLRLRFLTNNHYEIFQK